MALEGEYLGMRARIDDIDCDNQSFYRFCGAGELRLQQCNACGLKRFPPTTACPWCAAPECSWEPVEGRGTLYSYGEVHHAIMPAFREFTPYLLLLVELNEQRGQPNHHDGLRMNGNLVTADATMAPAEKVRAVGIGTRLRVVFRQIGDSIALPQWTIDEEATQPETVWRYPRE